jgi:hypothetical protein
VSRTGFVFVLLAALLSACTLAQTSEVTPTIESTAEATGEVTAEGTVEITPEATEIAQLPTREPTKAPDGEREAVPPERTEEPKLTATPLATNTPAATQTPTFTASPTRRPPTVAPECEVYLTYAGNDPSSFLSLRERPSTRAPQVTRLPNNTQVIRVAGSEEVAADDYHWLHIIYTDQQRRSHEGWAARDSFVTGGARDPSVATLQATGTMVPC